MRLIDADIFLEQILKVWSDVEALGNPEITKMFPNVVACLIRMAPTAGGGLDSLANKAYTIAKEHGWHEEERPFAEIVALCHSELSEALEEYRNGKPMEYEVDGKPEGIAVEMVDCIIRILDWAGANNINLDGILERKMEYNRSRSYRHGGKKI